MSFGGCTYIAKTLRLTSIRHRSDTKVSDRCLMDVYPRVFAIWDVVLSVGYECYHLCHWQVLEEIDRVTMAPHCIQNSCRRHKPTEHSSLPCVHCKFRQPPIYTKSPQKTSHSSSMRARYGVSFVTSTSDWVLPKSQQCCVQYNAILDHVIVVFHCIFWRPLTVSCTALMPGKLV